MPYSVDRHGVPLARLSLEPAAFDVDVVLAAAEPQPAYRDVAATVRSASEVLTSHTVTGAAFTAATVPANNRELAELRELCRDLVLRDMHGNVVPTEFIELRHDSQVPSKLLVFFRVGPAPAVRPAPVAPLVPSAPTGA